MNPKISPVFFLWAFTLVLHIFTSYAHTTLLSPITASSFYSNTTTVQSKSDHHSKNELPPETSTLLVGKKQPKIYNKMIQPPIIVGRQKGLYYTNTL